MLNSSIRDLLPLRLTTAKLKSNSPGGLEFFAVSSEGQKVIKRLCRPGSSLCGLWSKPESGSLNISEQFQSNTAEIY